MITTDIKDLNKILFLIGAPRSGTTWLQLLLSRSPSIASAPETHLFSSYLRSMLWAWENRQQANPEIGLHHLFNDSEFTDLIRHIVIQVFGKIARTKPGASVVLEKTPGHAFLGREILKIVPNAHFIHMVRDPRGAVCSLMAIRNERQGGSWAPADAHGAAQMWIDHVSSARSIRLLTPAYREVTYRDLHEIGAAKLFELFRWLGIDATMSDCQQYFSECEFDKVREARIDNTPFDIHTFPDRRTFFRSGKVDTWRRTLSRREIMTVECMTADLMAEYGFQPVFGSWLKRVYRPIHLLRTQVGRFVHRYQ